MLLKYYIATVWQKKNLTILATRMTREKIFFINNLAINLHENTKTAKV